MAKGSRASDSSSSGGGAAGGSQLRLELVVDSSRATKNLKKATREISNELKLTRKEVDKTGKLFKDTFARSIPDSFKKANSALNNFAQNNKKQIRFIRIQFKALKTEAMALRSALTTVYTGITGLLVGRQIQQSFRAAATKELAAARTGEVSELFGANTAEIQKGILDLRREGLFTYGALAYSARQLASMNLQVEGSIEDMLRAFRNIAVVEGFYEDINFSITSFIKGIQTGTAELLENLSPRIRTMIVDMGGFAKIQQDVNLRNQLLNNILRDGKVQQEAYNRVAATSEIRLKKLQTRYTELLETFGEGLLPVFNDFADLMDNVVRNLTAFFSSLDDTEKRAAALTATFSALVLLLAGPFLSALQLVTAVFRTGITVINLYARSLQVLYSIMVAVMAIQAPIAAVIAALVGIAGALGAFFGIKGVIDSVTESLSDTSSAAEDAYDKYNALSSEIGLLNNEYMTLQKSIAASGDAMDKVNLEKYQAEVLRSAEIVDILNQKQTELIGISRKLAAEGAGISLRDATRDARQLGFAEDVPLTSENLRTYMDVVAGDSPKLAKLNAKLAEREAKRREYEENKKLSYRREDKAGYELKLLGLEFEIEFIESEIKTLSRKESKARNTKLKKLGGILQKVRTYEEFYGGFTDSLGGTLTQTQGGASGLRGRRITNGGGLPGISVRGAQAGPDARTLETELASLQNLYFDQLSSLSSEVKIFEAGLEEVIENMESTVEDYNLATENLDRANEKLAQLIEHIKTIATSKALDSIASGFDKLDGGLKSIQDSLKDFNKDVLNSFANLAKGISSTMKGLSASLFQTGIIGAQSAASLGAAASGVGLVGSLVGVFGTLFGGLFDTSEEQLKEMERQRALQEAQNNYLKTLVDIEIDRQKSEREGIDREIERLQSVAEREKALLEGQFTGEELRKKQLEIDEQTRNRIIQELDKRMRSLQESGLGSLYDPKDVFLTKQGGTVPTGRTQRERISEAIMDREEIMRLITQYQGERAILDATVMSSPNRAQAISNLTDKYSGLLDPFLSEKDRERRRESYGRYSTMQRLGTPGIGFTDFINTLVSTNESDNMILTESLDILNRIYDLETEGIKTNNELLGDIADNTKAVDLQQAQERGFSFIDISRGGLQQAGLFRGTRMSSLISDITTPTTLGNLVAVTEAKTTQQKMLDTLNDQLSELRIHTALLAKLTNSDPTRQVNDGLTTLSSALKVG